MASIIVENMRGCRLSCYDFPDFALIKTVYCLSLLGSYHLPTVDCLLFVVSDLSTTKQFILNPVLTPDFTANRELVIVDGYAG